MRTQSEDTSPEAERVQIEMIRKMPLAKRFDRVRSWTKIISRLNLQDIRERYPNASEEEIALRLGSSNYDGILANGLQKVLKGRITKISDAPDLLAVIKSAVDTFEQLGVAYYIGGSVASSIYGMVQAAQDVDVIVNLQLEHIHPLLAQLQADYYIDEEAVRDAIQHRTWFSTIHLESMLKMDMFLPKNRPFDQLVLRRAQRHLLGEDCQPFYIASPEDIILTQLVWHRRGGKVADDKWNEILGVLKVQGTALDMNYLQRWAAVLDVTDLLERALVDAGLKG